MPAEKRQTQPVGDKNDIVLQPTTLVVAAKRTREFASAIGLLSSVPDQIAFVCPTKEGLQVPLGFACTSGYDAAGDLYERAETFTQAQMIHNQQTLAVERALIPGETIEVERKLARTFDLGRFARVDLESTGRDDEGKQVFVSTANLLIRNGGGWKETPDKPYDSTVPEILLDSDPVDTAIVPIHQIMVDTYGRFDNNMTHLDPEVAAKYRFPRPVVHGLLTYNIALDRVMRSRCNGDQGRVRHFWGRFSKFVFAGNDLEFRFFEPTPGTVLVQGIVRRNGIGDKDEIAFVGKLLYANSDEAQ